MRSNAIKTQSEIGQFVALAEKAQQISSRKQALDLDLEDAPDEFKGKGTYLWALLCFSYCVISKMSIVFRKFSVRFVQKYIGECAFSINF